MAQPKFVISIIPQERVFVTLFRGGVPARFDRVGSRTEAVQAWLTANVTDPPWSGKLVVQAPPWNFKRIQDQNDLLGVRKLTETAARWVTLAELKGIPTLYASRSKWITGLLNSGAAERGVDGKTNVVKAARGLSKRADLDEDFANATCLGFWCLQEASLKDDGLDDLDEEQL